MILLPTTYDSVTSAAAITIASTACRRTGNQTSAGVVGKVYNNPRVCVDGEKEVTINGERRVYPPGATLLDVVKGLGLEPDRVAVELNRVIARRDAWQATTFDAGAEIEVVQFVGGG